MPPSQRPTAKQRRLEIGQNSEIVIIDRDGKNREVIYETGELIEAPN